MYTHIYTHLCVYNWRSVEVTRTPKFFLNIDKKDRMNHISDLSYKNSILGKQIFKIKLFFVEEFQPKKKLARITDLGKHHMQCLVAWIYVVILRG